MRRVSLGALLVALLLGAAPGCHFAPPIGEGTVACGPDQPPCPPGFQCAADNKCYQHPPGITIDAPMSMIDAPAKTPDAPTKTPDARVFDAPPGTPDAFVMIDARPAGTTAPTIYGTYGGGGGLGTTSVPGTSQSVVTIGQCPAGTTGGAGMPNKVELGLLPGVKIP